MSNLSVRIIRRTEINGKTHEESIGVETFQQPTSASSGTVNIAPNHDVDPGKDVSIAYGVATSSGFSKVLADGTRIPGTDPRADHVAVIDHATGLMWSIKSLGDPDNAADGITQEHCIERCKQLSLLGFEDWRLPSRSELAALIDDTRHQPAIDTNLFPKVKARWHWTSTPAAWSSASAWGVHFSGGLVSGFHRGDDGFALAVRPAGQ